MNIPEFHRETPKLVPGDHWTHGRLKKHWGFARHLDSTDDSADQAIAADLVEAQNLVSGVSVEWLIEGLPNTSEERKLQLIDLTKDLIFA